MVSPCVDDPPAAIPRSAAAFVVLTVLAPPARAVLTAVPAVPAFPTIPALLVVPVGPEVGTAVTVPAAATVTAEAGDAVDQHRRGQPPQGVEETEAEQDQGEDEEQDEHNGPPGSWKQRRYRGLGPLLAA